MTFRWRRIVLGCAVPLLCGAAPAFGANDTAVHFPPLYNSFLPPAMGQSYIDPVFGVSIKRVSDSRHMTRNDGSGFLAWVSTEYSTASPFNSNNTWLILQHQSYFGLYDGSGSYLRDLPLAVNASTEPRWSRTDPKVLYYVVGKDLWRLDVAAGTSSIVRSFGEYAAIRGRGESDISRDGDHFVFAADEPSGPVLPGLANRYVFVYTISTDTKGPVLDTIGHTYDDLYLAPDNSVAIGWLPTGTSRFTGIELFNSNMVFQRQLTHAIGHQHLTRDTNGDDLLVWTNSGDPQPIPDCQNGIVKVRLSDAHQTCLLQLDWSLAVHITAGDGNGWVFVGTYDPFDPLPAVPGWKVYTNEMLQVKLDGTETRRLLHHRSRQTANYQYQPRATVSRDGSRLVFTSNYDLQAILGYPSEYTDAYYVSVPTTVGQPVQWTNLVGVTASGNSLTRGSGAAAWNAGAVSRQTLTSGDGQVEFVASETTTDRMLGLGVGDAGQDYADIEHAVYLSSHATYAAYEAGVARTGSAAFSAGDHFTVGVESGVARYRRNGVLFYSSALTPRYPLLVDTSLFSPGSTVTDARVSNFTTPPPALSINDVSVTESNAGSLAARFTVSLSAAADSTVTVSYATANGTAVAPSDYASASGTLTFAVGELTKTIDVTVNGDTLYEPTETFSITLSSPVNAVIGDSQGIGMIVNDELAPAVQWTNLVGVTASGNSLTRGSGAAAWNAGAVSRQTLTSGDGQVEFVASETTTDRMLGLGVGDAGQDYADIEHAVYLSSHATYAAYEAGVARTGSAAFSAGDHFTVGVESGVVRYRRNGVLFYSSALTPRYPLLVDTSLFSPGSTVTDARVSNFTTPPPALSINDVSVTESNAGSLAARFTVSLSAAADSTVTVSYATANGTAVAPSDYASASGTLTFAVGELTKTIDVTVNGDTLYEPTETFSITLSSPVNAVIGDSQGIGMIVNDELAPAVQWTNLVGVTASGNSLTRGSGAAAWNAGAVSRQTLTSGDGQVEFVASETTTDRMLGLGVGDAGQDYADIEHAVYLSSHATYAAYEAGVARTGSAAFSAGDHFTVGVESGVARYRRNGVLFYSSALTPRYPLLVDTSLFSPGSTVTDARVSNFTTPPPALSINDVSVTESNAGSLAARFTVSLSAAADSTVTVSYATANGTAVAPSDYASASGTLTFAVGELTKTIDVTVNGDTLYEPTETFSITLSSPVNAVIGDSQGIGMIVNDELAPAVQWTNLVGVTASGNSLTRGSGAAAWNAGAVSRQTLTSGDGQVEFVASETTTDRMLGLGVGDAGQDYADIEHAVYLSSHATYAAYEAGVARTGSAAFSAGDHFTVGVESGVVRYRRNGVLFYSSALTPRYPLLVDTSLFSPGSTVTDARVSNFTLPQ